MAATSRQKKFILIFKARWLRTVGYKYDWVISPSESNMISRLCEVLKEKRISVDKYMKWVFNVFLKESPKFCPPQIKLLCSWFVLHKFFYESQKKSRGTRV